MEEGRSNSGRKGSHDTGKAKQNRIRTHSLLGILQSDQMTTLFLIYLATYKYENLPNSFKKLPKYDPKLVKY